jgi:hypothetical protein
VGELAVCIEVGKLAKVGKTGLTQTQSGCRLRSALIPPSQRKPAQNHCRKIRVIRGKDRLASSAPSLLFKKKLALEN